MARNLMCALVVAALILSMPAGAAGGDEPAVAEPFTPERNGEPQPLDIVLLLDSSPSTQKTDPEDQRLRAAHLVLGYLQTLSDLQELPHRISVANFGGEVGRNTPLLPADSQGLREEIVDETLPWTDFRPALDFARKQLRRSQEAGRASAILLFTDGLPELRELKGEKALRSYFSREGEAEPGGGASLAALVDQLDAQDTQLFVIALGSETLSRDGWSDLLHEGHLFHDLSTDDLPATFLRIVVETAGLSVLASDKVEPGKEIEFQVPPLTASVSVSLLTSESGSGVIVLPEGGGQHHVTAATDTTRTLQNPASAILAGSSWRIRGDEGRATALVAASPARVRWSPAGTVPAGLPITVTARIEPAPQLPNGPLPQIVIVPAGDDQVRTTLNTHLANGALTSETLSFTPGEHLVRLQILAAETIEGQSARVEAVAIPKISEIEVENSGEEDQLVLRFGAEVRPGALGALVLHPQANRQGLGFPLQEHQRDGHVYASTELEPIRQFYEQCDLSLSGQNQEGLFFTLALPCREDSILGSLLPGSPGRRLSSWLGLGLLLLTGMLGFVLPTLMTGRQLDRASLPTRIRERQQLREMHANIDTLLSDPRFSPDSITTRLMRCLSQAVHEEEKVVPVYRVVAPIIRSSLKPRCHYASPIKDFLRNSRPDCKGRFLHLLSDLEVNNDVQALGGGR